MTIALKIAIIIVATVLPLPIEYSLFPKLERKKEKDTVGEKTETMKTLEWMSAIAGLMVLSGVSIIISVCSLFGFERETWYWYLIPMAYPIFCKFVFACTYLQKRLLPFALPILAIAFIGCIILPIRDGVLKYEPELLNSEMIVETKETLLSKTEIKARLNASSISEAGYYGGKYIYEINKGTSGYGLALVDTQKMEFLPCEYENQVSGIIREHYPKEEIVQFGIEIRDSVPYAKFGILKRPHIFSKPEIDFYVLLNMGSGQITERSN